MFNWFRVLWNLTDEKLLELNGADYTLYLVFLRQTAKFFAVVSIFNAIFMIPMFVSGDPVTNLPLQPTIMNTITVINVTANNGKMMFTYFSSILLMSGFGFTLIIRYR
jgi:Late exocytosis, associated with Golgi transport